MNRSRNEIYAQCCQELLPMSIYDVSRVAHAQGQRQWRHLMAS